MRETSLMCPDWGGPSNEKTQRDQRSHGTLELKHRVRFQDPGSVGIILWFSISEQHQVGSCGFQVIYISSWEFVRLNSGKSQLV